jgi:hypothetical protein
MAAFDAQECRTLAAAFDLAWDMLQKSGRLADEEADIAKGALARAILDGAQRGQQNARQLAVFAIGWFERYRKEVAAEREWRQNPHLVQATKLLARGGSARPALQATISADPQEFRTAKKEPARWRDRSQSAEAQTHSPALATPGAGALAANEANR